MATQTRGMISRLKIWMVVAALVGVGLYALPKGWGGGDDAIIRDQEDSERRREAVIHVDATTSKYRDWFVSWGKRGAMHKDVQPTMPFERVVDVQRGDTVVVWAVVRQEDKKLSCSITVDGVLHKGEIGYNECSLTVQV